MSKRPRFRKTHTPGRIFKPVILLLLFLCFGLWSSAPAQSQTAPPEEQQIGAPVTLDGEPVFDIQATYKGLTLEERAVNVSSRLAKLANDGSVPVGDIKIVETEQSADVVYGDTVVFAAIDADAEVEGKSRRSVAEDRLVKIKNAVSGYREKYGLRGALIGIGLSVATLAIFLLITYLIRRNFPKLRDWSLNGVDKLISARKWRVLKLIDVEQVKGGAGFVLNLLRLALVVTLFFITLQLILGFLPWTTNIANQLLSLIVGPLKTLGTALVSEIPNLMFIAVIVTLAYYLLKMLKAFFRAIQFRRITFRSFAPEWAMFTYRLIKIAVVLLALVVSFPYIPGSDSEAFRAVGIFLGVLVSFGSSSIVSNTIGGITVNYLRTFNVGDRVKIGEHTGDIIRSSLQVTHLRTIKNEEIMVPNSMVVGSQIVNYSTYAKEKGLILHTKVTIGYDTPWRQVHALLLSAAEKTEGLLKEPKPFILQTSLDDFYASYELNVYTHRPQEMARIYSQLHENIQDEFNEFGVQIMSPNYIADRSEKTWVPKENWFEAPAKKSEPEEGES